MFSDPVVGEKFFGRANALSLFSKRVGGLKDGYRQNIAILGPNLIGKSSLVLHFFSNFSHPKILPIYVDLKANSFSRFIYKFLGALLYHYLKTKNLCAREDLDSLKQCAQNYIPKTTEAIRQVESDIKNSQFSGAYQKLLCLPAVLKQESGSSCIVILDEFHFLNTYKLKNPFQTLAKEIMMQKDTMYVLISSQLNYAKKVLAGELSLLFGNFEIIYLQPFDYNTCCKFLERRFQNIHLPHNVRDFLIAFSDGRPFYLDILSSKLKEKAKELNRMEITHGVFSQALNSLIYDSQGILNQYFTSLFSHKLNGADYSNFLPILLFASERGMRLSDIARITSRQPKLICSQANCLLEKDLLDKVGAFYRIEDKIFRFWLKSAYQRKSLSLSADPVTESKDFSKEIEDRIQAFSQEAKKLLSERIIELFKSFRNEIIMLQNKFFKFWRFEEICLQPLEAAQDYIIARYKGGAWACLIKKEKLDEAQIEKFFSACKKSKYKIRRAIVISLKELDLNVRLMALQRKVWVWSLSDLNLLLDLYGKQQIIH